jgi:hypothetical protein
LLNELELDWGESALTGPVGSRVFRVDDTAGLGEEDGEERVDERLDMMKVVCGGMRGGRPGGWRRDVDGEGVQICRDNLWSMAA